MDSTAPQSHNTHQTTSRYKPVSGRTFVWTMLLAALILFVTEFAVMCMLPSLKLSGAAEMLVDAVLLAVLAIGPLYFLGFHIRSPGEQPSGRSRHFHLFRYFLIGSGFAIAAILLIVGLNARGVQKDNCIAGAKKIAYDVAEALRDTEIRHLFELDATGNAELAMSTKNMSELDRGVRKLLTPFGIVKLKVFNHNTRIIYSTDSKIIGKLNRANADLRTTLAGGTISKMEYKDSVLDLVSEQRFDVDVVETYLPVRAANGDTIGAFEIYKDVTSEFHASRSAWLRSTWTLAIVLLAVFAGLSALMHRAAQIIQSRGADLERSRDELGEQNTILKDTLERETRLAAQLEIERENAESSNRAKSEFLANMSHEIRTPMTAILGFADNLLDNDLPAVERIDAVRTIGRNGTYLLSIINDILDLSKIEAGKMVVENIPCDPCQIVAEVTSLMRIRSDAKGLAFNVDYVGPIPKTIQNDPVRLRQVLINLLGNAIKFTDNGEVRLVTRVVEGECEDRLCNGEDKDNLCRSVLQFDVSDTGLGMTYTQVDKLFDPFTQGDASTTREYGGTGLGLTISKRFALLLGGDITVVETEPGVGTTVRASVATGPLDGVEFLKHPLASIVIEHPEHDSVDLGERALSRCRILLAEDAPDNQRLISVLLRKSGAEVVVEENGKLAMSTALAARSRGRPFDIILMDMQMPVMDGYAATRGLRDENYEWPIIALTAHTMEGDRQKCIDAGCNDYASKPIDRKTLIEIVRKNRQTTHTVATA